MKSLDEIKREKELRQLGASTTTSSSSAHVHAVTSHDSLQAGGPAEDTGKDRNLLGKIPIAYRLEMRL